MPGFRQHDITFPVSEHFKWEQGQKSVGPVAEKIKH